MPCDWGQKDLATVQMLKVGECPLRSREAQSSINKLQEDKYITP